MDNKRRKFSAVQKVEILREHFKNKLTISEICVKYNIHPNLFYRWEKESFEGLVSVHAGALKRNGNKALVQERKLKGRIRDLEEVIAWLTRENLELKKSAGDV